MKKTDLPDFAKPFKKKCFDVRFSKSSYKLYKISSKRMPDRKYPVLQQEYIGVIDPDAGLIPKKTRPASGSGNVEYGLSHLLYLNFGRELTHSTFNGRIIDVKIAIALYLFGSTEERFLKLSYLTCMDPIILKCAKTANAERLQMIVEKMKKLLATAVPDESDRKYILACLRQITVNPADVKAHAGCSKEVSDLLERYGLRYG